MHIAIIYLCCRKRRVEGWGAWNEMWGLWWLLHTETRTEEIREKSRTVPVSKNSREKYSIAVLHLKALRASGSPDERSWSNSVCWPFSLCSQISTSLSRPISVTRPQACFPLAELPHHTISEHHQNQHHGRTNIPFNSHKSWARPRCL